MNRSRNAKDDLIADKCALQHEHAPRPLPLFLELVAKASETEPDLARRALAGLRAYEGAPRGAERLAKPEAARIGGACLRDHGGSGPPAILIPSLINPPHILDLDSETSLAEAVKAMGRHVLLLDWGSADERSHLSVAGHVEQLLVPLIAAIKAPAALVGYCLGGTMAIAAASLALAERVATLASPWHFANYPADSRAALANLWAHSKASAQALGALPMELLQAAFWSLDPIRTVSKFADFDALAPGSAGARRFVALEDWANEGEALPYPAAQELIERLFGADLPGQGEWIVGGKAMSDSLTCPL
ncbi:MAG: alpha/beta hydrolase, partial [Sphingomicrobium sp.]